MNFKQVLNQRQVVPVILGSSVNAFGQVRSFAQHKIKSIVVDHQQGPAAYSKDAYFVQCADPVKNKAQFAADLLALGRQLTESQHRGFILCSGDDYLYAVGSIEEQLKPNFILPMSKWQTMEKVIDKSYLYPLAQKHDVSCPKTFIIDNIAELEKIREQIPYPCILKPAVTVGFTEKLGLKKKAVQVESPEEMVTLEKLIIAKKLDQTKLIIQEVIPGGVENLYTVTAYTDTAADILAYSIGYKIRQYPADAGTITAGRVTHVPELFEQAAKVLQAMNLHGISNTEFKKDYRDGKYKLIEINPRPGLWNFSTTAAGVNLPMLAYQNKLGEFAGPAVYSEQELVWLLDITDFVRTLTQAKGLKAKFAALVQWFRSTRGKRVHAIWSRQDPRPFLAYLRSLIFK